MDLFAAIIFFALLNKEDTGKMVPVNRKRVHYTYCMLLFEETLSYNLNLNTLVIIKITMFNSWRSHANL